MSSKKRTKTSVSDRIFVGNDVIRNFAQNSTILLSCLCNLSEILEEEHCPSKRVPFCNGELAINFDKYEAQLAKSKKSSREPTVDCIIGLQHNWLLLVEIKYDVKTKTMDTIAKNIKEKRNYSRNVLKSYDGFHCEGKMVILLNDDQFEIKKRKLLSCLNNKVNEYKVMTVSGFYDSYFNTGSIPKQ